MGAIDGGGVAFNSANSYIWLGSCLLQWGTATSSIDTDQDFSFPTTFPNACAVVFTNRTEANNEHVLPVTAKTTTEFTINRDDALVGSLPFYWFAIGF